MRLEGVDELNRVFKALPRKIGERAVLNSVRAGARVVAKQVKTEAPVGETGNLKKSVVVRTVKKRFRTSDRLVFVGFKKPAGSHAHLVEFGHGGPHPAPPHPFIVPAAVKTRESAVRTIITALGDQINKQATGLIKKFGANKRRGR